MADLSDLLIDPTIRAMKSAIKEKSRKEKKRDYVGASGIGHLCSRKIWYDYTQDTEEDFSAETLMRFEDGHRMEFLTAARLNMVDSVSLKTVDENGYQFGFSDFDGKFKGHVDGFIVGLIDAPKAVHVWEHKSCGYEKFNELASKIEKFGAKQALMHWNEVYYAQAQVYMHYFKLDRHYMTVSLNGGVDYIGLRTNYNKSVALSMVEKAKYIIESSSPPRRISEKRDFYLCTFCRHREICHGAKEAKDLSGSMFEVPF